MPSEIVPNKDPTTLVNAPIQRGWMPYAIAAKLYLGIAPDVLLRAIKRGELPAYEKPITRGRTAAVEKQRHSYFVCPSDIDTWIRTYWLPAVSNPT